MQTIAELGLLVERGYMTKESAERVIGAVISSVKDTHDLVRKSLGQDDELSKTANKASLGGQLMTGLLSSVGLTLGGLGVNYLVDKHEQGKTRAAHERSFHEMHRLRPEISKIEPAKVQEYFSVMRDVSPELAKNPFIAANFIERQNAGYGGVGFEEAGALARADESIRRGKGPSTISALGDSLTQQGVTQIGGNVGYVTRLGLDEAMKPDAKELGRREAIKEDSYDLHTRQSGLMGRKQDDEYDSLSARDEFAQGSEERREEASLRMHNLKTRDSRSLASEKMKADLAIKERESQYNLDNQKRNYADQERMTRNRWGGKPTSQIVNEGKNLSSSSEERDVRRGQAMVDSVSGLMQKRPARSRIDFSEIGL